MLRKILVAAFLYVDSSLSVIPIRPDGSKAPALSTWGIYRRRRPTETELSEWFDNDLGYGIAIVGGAISGSLEIFDCDAPELFPPWCALVESICQGLLARLIVIQTPSGGYHVYYRCSEIEGNQKLAQRLVEIPEEIKGGRWIDRRYMKIETLLETRGEGGYVLSSPTPPECHPDRKPYILLSGELSSIPTISPQERAVMHDVARSFNEHIQPERIYHGSLTPRLYGPCNRPGDDYNARADWYSLLTSYGWRYAFKRGDVSYWRRPGKPDPGISATTNYAGSNLLYVFSSNAAPFEEKAAYSLFSAYSILEHNGDFHAAAKALSQKGYGQKTKVTLLSHLKPISKPIETIKLDPVKRPKDTIRLS